MFGSGNLHRYRTRLVQGKEPVGDAASCLRSGRVCLLQHECL